MHLSCCSKERAFLSARLATRAKEFADVITACTELSMMKRELSPRVTTVATTVSMMTSDTFPKVITAWSI